MKLCCISIAAERCRHRKEIVVRTKIPVRGIVMTLAVIILTDGKCPYM